MRYNALIEKLQNLTNKKITQTEICNVLNIKQSALSNRQKRNSHFSEEEIALLEHHFDILLVSGSDCVEIDYIHLSPSCGYGTATIDEPDVTPIKLGKKMLETVLRVTDITNLKIFRASGDSMTDTIDDGNILLVDLGRLDYQNGGVFLLQKNNDWFIKRLRLKLTGELEVISDNPKYGVEIFKPDSDVDIRIRGRVIKNLSKGL